MKTCTGCREDLDLDHFGAGRGRGGLKSRCKRCEAASSRAYHNANRDRVRERQRVWRENNPEKVQAKNSRRRDVAGHVWYRDAQLQRMYGITAADYERMLEEQGGCCYLCGSPPKKQRLSVDHDHRTGKVRHLLCSRCNAALGWFESSPEFAMKVLDYSGVVNSLETPRPPRQ